MQVAVESQVRCVSIAKPRGMRTFRRSVNCIWTYIFTAFLVMAQGAIAADPPILVIGSSSNPFSNYYVEILRAEGLNSFEYKDLSDVSSTTLTDRRLVLLGAVALTSSEAGMFTTWVNNGGKLIAMRPDKQLASLLGLTDTAATLTDGYLLVNTAASPGKGIVNQTMQIHGAADRYTLAGASSIAALYSNAATATPHPAVSIRSVGSNGGEAAAFTYDLAFSIARTRQGNPAWSGQERDGITPIRSNDLFFGAAAFDQKPDWVDPNKIGIPQADEQQRLLANLMTHLLRDRIPLPRFWYLPFFKKAAVVLTGDDHAGGGTAGRFDSHSAASNPGCSIDNWECIRSTSYVFPNSPLTNSQAVQYMAQGFEVALHTSTQCADWTPSSLEANYASELADWTNRYSAIAAPKTNRTHCIVWSDYDTQPQVELSHGIRLDTNYYYWPGSWLAQTPGYFTGSAIPMKFTKADGTTINVYQATTQMTDESSQVYPGFAESLFDAALGATGYYGVFTANIHTDESSGPTQMMSDHIVAAAKARNVPVISALQLLRWLDARDGSVFSNMSWNGTALTFSVAPGANANGLRGMLPAAFNGGGLTAISRDGSAVSYTLEIIKGITYAVFPATAGSYQATYGTTSSVAVSVSPASVSLNSSEAQQFTALVTGTGNTAVTWAIYPAIGTISTSGLYTAPAEVSNAQVQVVAYSVADPSRSAFATVQLIAPPVPLTISSVTTTGSAGSAVIEWTTNEESSTVVNFGTAPGQLTQQVTIPGSVTAHSALLSGLTVGARYYYRVTSTTAGQTTATWPTASLPAASFYASATNSIWNRSAVPVEKNSNETLSVELGMKFRSTANGNVTGIRFYKGADNTGEHVATLWSSNGSILGRINIASETPSGWQEATFDTPVAITANTTYLISYFLPNGHYPVTISGLANAAVSGSLRALSDAESGGNGVYKYSSAPVFPDESWSASNYWVDVLFTTTAAADVTPPVISGVTASPSTTGAIITWTTNEASNSTVLYGTASANLNLTATGNTNATSHTVSLSGLASGTTYYYRVQSADAAGNTAASPAPASAPASFTTTAVDTTPPVISAIAAAPSSDRATITWTTNEPANSRVDYGTTAALGQNASDAALVTSHSITILGLTPGTSYQYRLTSVDASGNSAQSPAAPVLTFTTSTSTSVSLWSSQATPAVLASDDTSGVELGVKFRASTSGYVTGVRFYKGPGNTGTHIGHLWAANGGSPLATVTFMNETAGGWQQALFSSPVLINANTTYVVSYYAPVGRYSYTASYFNSNDYTNGPLTAPATGTANGNGVFRYSSSPGFPDGSWGAANYWVDVVFTTIPPAADTTPPVISAVVATPSNTTATITWTTNEPSTSVVEYGTSAIVLSSSATSAGMVTSHSVTLTGLTVGQTYHFRVISKDAANNIASFPTGTPLSFTTTATVSFWDNSVTPAVTAAADPSGVELGMKFRSDVAGQIMGIRFYKGAGNTGVHTGTLWSATGQVMGTVTFINETASGWQQAMFTAPVSIAANTTYVVSYYAPAGNYSADSDYFTSQGVDRLPLHALGSGVDGLNGVYRYSGASVFPDQSYRDTNYWVDVIFKQ